ncbi:DUF485 domain-containing protein [Streptomyces verrucosisporus]|uniref:DUF485 domain-containing protein n=1 Tax=Streptomyces verrucosisporus TaxID=1695161 RepID=UPI0019CF505C|nr:DUF485 domain-containing protein [Streptomyces verrucosisporus]MBN3931941.1 DUF485 domain-containing protein [Streptomyces verrucosisporus]
MRIDDPWHDTLASGWGEERGATAAPFPRWPASGRAAAPAARPTRPRAAALRGTRRRRCLVLSAAAALLVCQSAYLVTATVSPAVTDRAPGGAPVTAGTVAGFAQFVTVCLLACAYARHTRPHRDGRGRTAGERRCACGEARAAGPAAPGRHSRAR